MSTINEADCYAMLSGSDVGRVGLVVDGRQEIIPVNYATDGQSIVIRTGIHSVLALHAPMAQIAFEVDRLDEETRSGWSVLMYGTAHQVNDSLDEAALQLKHLLIAPWAQGDKDCWLRLTPKAITGRRVP